MLEIDLTLLDEVPVDLLAVLAARCSQAIIQGEGDHKWPGPGSPN